jgi:hypothetical protein
MPIPVYGGQKPHSFSSIMRPFPADRDRAGMEGSTGRHHL